MIKCLHGQIVNYVEIVFVINVIMAIFVNQMTIRVSHVKNLSGMDVYSVVIILVVSNVLKDIVEFGNLLVNCIIVNKNDPTPIFRILVRHRFLVK